MSDTKYLADIEAKYFFDSYLADKCSFCGTRMIHPALGLYICPNENCQYSYSFHPDNNRKQTEVLKKSKLEKKYGK